MVYPCILNTFEHPRPPATILAPAFRGSPPSTHPAPPMKPRLLPAFLLVLTLFFAPCAQAASHSVRIPNQEKGRRAAFLTEESVAGFSQAQKRSAG